MNVKSQAKMYSLLTVGRIAKTQHHQHHAPKDCRKGAPLVMQVLYMQTSSVHGVQFVWWWLHTFLLRRMSP
jgi:hypothetical protein